MRGIIAGNPERARWAHLACSGSQSELRIRFILPTTAASDVEINRLRNYQHIEKIITLIEKE